jgi:hypothetical protein
LCAVYYYIYVSGGDAAKVVRNLMHELAAACEFANARLSVGVSQQAQVNFFINLSKEKIFFANARLSSGGVLAAGARDLRRY